MIICKGQDKGKDRKVLLDFFFFFALSHHKTNLNLPFICSKSPETIKHKSLT